MRTLKVFGAPSLYVQGPGAIAELGALIRGMGERVLLVSDARVAALLSPILETQLKAQGYAFAAQGFSGAVTEQAVAEQTQKAERFAPHLVVAAGGGKGVDMGKAVARALGARLVSLPTAASNDGATSRVFALHDAVGRVKGVERLPRNPEIVLVDTAIIAKAPPELLVSGIGDALVKRFEAAQCVAADGPNLFGARATLSALALAELADRVIRDNGEAALAAARVKTADAAFEKVVEACLLLGGLGFEGAGLSIAHAMTRGLAAAPQTARARHGLKAAYGLLVQFLLEHRTKDFLNEQFSFYRKVGLPIRLKDLGLADPRPADLQTIADLAHKAPHAAHFERALAPDDLVGAMARLEELSARASARAA